MELNIKVDLQHVGTYVLNTVLAIIRRTKLASFSFSVIGAHLTVFNIILFKGSYNNLKDYA